MSTIIGTIGAIRVAEHFSLSILPIILIHELEYGI